MFQTKNGMVYEIYFTEGDGYFPQYPLSEAVKVFGFRIANSENNNSKYFDKRVSYTIIFQIFEFFKNDTTSQSIILYVCDTKDKKHFFRKKLFDIWFKKYSSSLFLEKSIIYEDVIISAITHKENPILQEFKNIFDTLENNFK